MMTDSQPSLEVIAPSVDEAVARGAEELGVDQSSLEIEVLDEGSKGVFGVGARQARVRLTLRGESRAMPEAAVPARAVVSEPAEGDAAEDQMTLDSAKESVRDLLAHMDVTADVSAEWGQPDEPGKMRPLYIDVTGEDLSLLIGRRGDTLEALQYIVRLILGNELKKPVPAVIDVEGYRARREQTLRRLARRMADQALERQRTLSLEPMPPNERRIIHLELRDNSHVRTESVGEGDRRKVTIIPQR